MSKQQRRKGNAKNASSAAAHGYLAQGGATLVGLTPEMNIFEVASSNRLHQVSELDDETRIVIKKLTKKDCQTREKGLKELMELIKMETNSAESCYEHFCGLVPQLSTDGSPTVRMFTMKAITLFLIKLQKSASKGLKKIIPMVLLAKCDATNGVAAAASAAIRDGFDADKKQQIMQLFGPLTFEMAANIAQGKHELSAPIEYDASEEKDARKSRLETQSLNVFLSYIKEFGTESNIWEEHARKLFANSEYIKKAFAGNKETVKVQLLNLCYRFENNVDVILSIAPIVPYIQNALDVQTFTPECATSWEGIVLLLHNSKFQAKFSLQKGILPRFLNVIRKKGNHWRVLKHYLLPAVVVLLQELKNPESNEKTLISIMESFIDNLPWPTDTSMNAIHCWFNTFSDFVRWILSNDRVSLEITKTIVPLTIKMTEQAMMFSTAEATECISGLLHWIIESSVLQESEVKALSELIEKKLGDVGKEKSRLLKDALTSPGKHVELSDLHAHLLSNPDLVDFHLIKNLALSGQIYFDATLNKINNFSFIAKTEQFDLLQAEDVARLILRILNNDKFTENPESLNITVKNDHVGRHLLLTGDSTAWEKLLKSTAVHVFQEMANYWHEKRHGKAIADAVNVLRKMGIHLDINEAARNIDFLMSLLHTMGSNDSIKLEEKSSLVLKLFAALFEADEEPRQEHYESMKNHLTANFDSGNFFETLFTNSEENDTERILEIVSRFDKLIGLCEVERRTEIAEKMLISQESVNSISEKFHFLELDVLTYSEKGNLITNALSQPIQHLEEREATKMIKEFGRICLFNLASCYHGIIHQVFGWQMIRVISSLGERYCLKALDDELNNLKKEIEMRVIRSDDVQKRSIENSSPNFIADIYGLPTELEKLYYGFDDEKSKALKINIDTLFSKPETPLEYLAIIFEATQSENFFPLFQFDYSYNYNWLANIMFVKRFIQCGGGIFSAENLELRDFALCGIVTVLDNVTDLLSESSHLFNENPRLEALTVLYMELFLILTESTKKGNQPEQIVEEWNEFYAPTINTYFIRMFRTVRKDQQPTPFIRTLLKVIFSLPEFPNDASSDDVTTREFVPELSVFKYSPFQESCISQAFSLFASNIEHIQLIGYAVSRLLMPLMFKVENETALKEQDSTEVTVSNRSKLALPIMVSKSYPIDHNHPHVGPLLLDLALIPLQNPDASFGQEHRVSYCDVIDPFFKNALNALMLDQPFEFRQVPIACRIQKSREREYYLESDFSASPIFFDKFASRLLFKSMTLLPAAVRLFHRGMPNCFMPMFQEAVTKFASKLLIEQELGKVREAKFEGDMKVRTVPVTGEIIAEYVIEETKMKLNIGLPPDYPLSVPTMTIDKAIVKSDRAKKWLMQLNAYLFHQNGAILEGIEMWKRNVDKGVEGVEDCTICMMTVHQQTHQLPKVRCKQCKNKFHSNCLYKWFESSNQSTCPLCRNNFT